MKRARGKVPAGSQDHGRGRFNNATAPRECFRSCACHLRQHGRWSDGASVFLVLAAIPCFAVCGGLHLGSRGGPTRIALRRRKFTPAPSQSPTSCTSGGYSVAQPVGRNARYVTPWSGPTRAKGARDRGAQVTFTALQIKLQISEVSALK